MSPVDAATIREMRMRAGLNQQEAAALVHRNRASRWHEWETGKCVMPLAELELFLLKTKLHKEYWK